MRQNAAFKKGTQFPLHKAGHWPVIDWYELTKGGPEWARALTANLNGWLDLFEWWSIHRQAPEGDIGGGWTDDVEIVPAFGLRSEVLVAERR